MLVTELHPEQMFVFCFHIRKIVLAFVLSCAYKKDIYAVSYLEQSSKKTLDEPNSSLRADANILPTRLLCVCVCL